MAICEFLMEHLVNKISLACRLLLLYSGSDECTINLPKKIIDSKNETFEKLSVLAYAAMSKQMLCKNVSTEWNCIC